MTATSPQRELWAEVEYAIAGDLRYLSHQDELRMLHRALARACWPVVHSRGHNPRPRVRVPLPRNLGVAATRQVAWVGLTQAADAAVLAERLAAAMPAGIELRRVRLLGNGALPGVAAAEYSVEVGGAGPALADRAAAVLAASTCVVTREYGPGKAPGTVDIRPSLEGIEVAGDRLKFRLRAGGLRTARPAELLTALGLAPESYHGRLERGELLWNHTRPPETGRAAYERTTSVSEEGCDDEQEEGREDRGEGRAEEDDAA